jgi:hypothetical protein
MAAVRSLSEGPWRARVGRKRPERLHGYRKELLRSMVDVTLPFTNTQAEQSLRTMKVKHDAP